MRYHFLLTGRAASVAGTAGSMHAVLHRAGAGRQQPGAELRDFLNVAPDQLQMNENKRVLSPLLDAGIPVSVSRRLSLPPPPACGPTKDVPKSHRLLFFSDEQRQGDAAPR